MDIIGLAVTGALGAMLTVSALAKLRGGRFVTDLANYHVLPTRLVVSIGTGLPWVELSVGVALLATPWQSISSAAAAVLLLSFTLGVVINLARGRRIPCGCRGTSQPISWQLAATNTAWAIAAIVSSQAGATSPVSALAGRDPAVESTVSAAVLAVVMTAAMILRLLTGWTDVHAAFDRVTAAVNERVPA